MIKRYYYVKDRHLLKKSDHHYQSMYQRFVFLVLCGLEYKRVRRAGKIPVLMERVPMIIVELRKVHRNDPRSDGIANKTLYNYYNNK